jgi:hypothetical protein
MTEEEWLACVRTNAMLRYILGTNQPRVQDIQEFPNCKASDRKLRLFACACYYHICHILPHPVARHAIETAEQFADGVCAWTELQTAMHEVRNLADELEPRWRASQG